MSTVTVPFCTAESILDTWPGDCAVASVNDRNLAELNILGLGLVDFHFGLQARRIGHACHVCTGRELLSHLQGTVSPSFCRTPFMPARTFNVSACRRFNCSSARSCSILASWTACWAWLLRR